MKSKILFACLLFFLLSAAAGYSQNAEILRNVNQYSASVKAVVNVDAILNVTIPIPACSPIPTQDQVNNARWTYEEHMYTLSQAISLKIPIVNVSGSTNLKIYIKDYKRKSQPCSASDGTRLYYGQIIRTVIEIENYDASLGVSLSAFAASATLGKSTQHFYFYKDGFYNPKIDGIISDVSGKDFNVENYYTFQQTLPRIQALLVDTQTTFSPAIVEVDNQADAEKKKISGAAFMVYALQNISKQTSFTSALTKYASNNDALAAIGEVYDYLNIPKDNTQPTKIQSLQANDLLNGLKVKW